MNKYETARELAVKALTALAPLDNKPVYAPAMLEWIKDNEPEDYPKVEKSWQSFVTKMQEDPDSRVVRDPGKYGFRLRDLPSPLLEEVEETVTTQQEVTTTSPPQEAPAARKARIQRERQLYALLASWLTGKDYRAADCSTARKGGSWGNPDVVGVHLFEGYGSAIHLELASVEAKLTMNNWRKDFFEAVAHKRFADRAYFAFAHGTDEPDVATIADLQQLRTYGEKYRVGVLVVFLQSQTYKDLCEAENEIDLQKAIYSVEEIWPAIHDPVPPPVRETFMRDVLDLDKLQDIIEFGD